MLSCMIAEFDQLAISCAPSTVVGSDTLRTVPSFFQKKYWRVRHWREMEWHVKNILFCAFCWYCLGLFLCQYAIAADFNGDGKQDIVWRIPAGNPLIWQMDGLTIGAQQTLPIAPDAASSIVGAGTFFGAGTGGILWIDSSGHVSAWQISNGNIVQSCYVASGIDSSWNFLGVGDVNADGRDDVLWQSPDGTITAFLIDGCNAATALQLNAAPAPSWSLAGIGDIYGNGYSDLIWRTSNGDLVVWQLAGGGKISRSTSLSAGVFADWKVSAVADFDGDGMADILWRAPDGNNAAMWLMHGTQFDVLPITASNASNPFDEIFRQGFESGHATAYANPGNWVILGAADVDGDGRADVLLANIDGSSAIWKMDGATIQSTALFAPIGEMPYAGLDGWKLPLDRPQITKVDGTVTVAWSPLAGSPSYSVFASSHNNPATTGVALNVSEANLSFARDDASYADKRYFSISAQYHGLQLPPSPEAYIVEFAASNLPYWGAMPITDINHDGCPEIMGALGDCHGNFQILAEADMGLSALRADGRVYRDARFADLDGDGIDDLIANVYSNYDVTQSHVMFFRGVGNNQFVEDAAFSKLQIDGFGETIVIADFNNDGYLDVFLPHYSFNNQNEHSYLLINDGKGKFTDVSDSAGVAMRNVSVNFRSEGAQALDINGDGLIDLYSGSHLFINQGNLTFKNVGPVLDPEGNLVAESPWGLPPYFDEGAKFIDWNNSGQLALALNTSDGLHILQYDGAEHFTELNVIPNIYMDTSYGLTAADFDGDGRTDLVVAGGYSNVINTDPAFAHFLQRKLAAAKEPDHDVDDELVEAGAPNALPQLLLNRGSQFVLHDFYDDGLQPATRPWNDLQTFADFDYSGTMDIVSRYANADEPDSGYMTILMNLATSKDTFRVTLLGEHGEHNQAGRIVRATPQSRPLVSMTQVVDGGSGYMANSPYDLTFTTPYPGSYVVSVRFANATYSATAHAGDHVVMYANGVVAHQ